MRKNKLKHLLSSLIGAISIASVLSFIPTTINQQNNFSTVVNSRTITQVPPPTTNINDVNTGVAVVRDGNNYTLPSLYLLELENNNKLDELKTYVQPYFYELVVNPQNNQYLPITNNPPQFTISNAHANNKEGKISFNVNFTKYIENGVEINNAKSIIVTISGFKSIAGPTIVELNPNFDFNNYNKGDLANDPDLLNESIVVKNLPDGATYKVEPLLDTITNDPKSFDVNVIVSSFFDQNVEFVNGEKNFEIKITVGLEGKSTSIVFKDNADKNVYASSITKDLINNYLFVSNVPDNSTITINFDPVNDYDNKKGEVYCTIIVSKLYQDSVILDGMNRPFNITISGFKKVFEPSTLKTFNNFSDFKPSDVNNQTIHNFLDTSLFPPNTTFTNGDFKPNNKDGILIIDNLVASSAFINDAKFSLAEQFTLPQITIDKLQTQSPTSIDVKDKGDPNILATSLNDVELLNNYIKINTLPGNAIVEIRNLVADNLKGQLTFNLFISEYYDDLGILKRNYLKTYWIDNFKTIFSSNIVQRTGVDLTNVYASQINETNIDQYADLSSFPESANLYSYEFKDVSNITGTLKFSLYASQWYDNKGFLQPTLNSQEKQKKFEIELTGFAIQNATTVEKSNVDNSNKIASEILTQQDVEPLIVISNESTDKNYPTWWTAGNFRTDNLSGKLFFTIKLNNYYDAKGIFRSIDDADYQPLIVDFEFNDFKIVNKSVVTQTAAPSTILPSSMRVNDIENYIDVSTFPDDADIKYTISNPINIKGTFDLTVSASKWFNDKGELIKNQGNFFVKIVGCKTQEPTDIIIKKNDLSNVSATDIDDVNKLNDLIEIKNPYGVMIPGNTWTATNYQPYNAKGELTVDIIINDYYDENGNPINNLTDNYKTLVKRITIPGFKKTTKSILLQNDKDPSQHLASEVHKTPDAWKSYIDFSSFPSRKEIIDVETFPSDLRGTLIVNTTIRYYYNEYGNEMSDNHFFRVELKGFKKQTNITRVLPIDNIDPNVTTYDAADLADNNPNEFIKKYVDVINPAPGAKIILNSKPLLNHKNGSMTLSISIDKYYDQDGNFVDGNTANNIFFSQTINVSGFKKIEKSEIIQNKFYDFSNYTPEKFRDEFYSLPINEQINKFKEITVFNSTPRDMTFTYFNLEPINNLGQLSITTNPSKLYDGYGNIISNPTITILFDGFKKNDSSILVLNSFDKNFPATDLVIDQTNFWDYFDATRFPTDVKIVNVSNFYSNIKGTISVTATFDKYFGIDGNLVEESIAMSVEIAGFNKINNKSKLLQKSNISQDLLNKVPTDVILNDKVALFNDLVDTSLFPKENILFGINPTKFNISNPIANNIDGTVRFNVTADKMYGGDDCNLILEPSQFEITINGFVKNKASYISIKNNLLPSQVSYNDLEFVNFPTIPTVDQVKFGIRNDQNGFIEIIVLNCTFYNEEGVLQTNKEFKFTKNIKIDTKENDNTTMILIISLSSGIGSIVLISLFIWWRWYKKTHAV